jgi:hypothetical protein
MILEATSRIDLHNDGRYRQATKFSGQIESMFPLLNWRKCNNQQIMVLKEATVMLAWRAIYHIFPDCHESPLKSFVLGSGIDPSLGRGAVEGGGAVRCSNPYPPEVAT